MIGQTLGRYHILSPLGQGGMATVYRARDTTLERDVAIKFIRTGVLPDHLRGEMLVRFRREAQSLSRLSHPHILPVYDYGEHAGELYLVTAFMAGGTLDRKLGRALPYAEAAQLLAPIARALDYAHSLHIVHRDIKPANILLSATGLPVLGDFGIAKLLEGEGATRLTGTGVGIGTPAYMAPEQATNKDVDHRADIYALGIVLYELVTGRLPFEADTPFSVLMKHVNEKLPSPRSLVPDLPDAVEQVLFKALAKRPADRFQTMGAFADSLEQLRAEQPPTRPNRLPRRWRLAALAALVGVGAVGLLGVAASVTLAVMAARPPTATVGMATATLPAATPSRAPTQPPATHTAAPTRAPSPEPVQRTQAASLELTRQAPAATPVLDGGGGLIAFNSSRGGSNDIYVMQWDGSEVTRMTSSAADERVPAWSPDGTRLAYYSNADGDYELYVLSFDTGAAQQVTHNSCGDFVPQWSPDGRRLVYYADCDGNREIYTINPDGTGQTQVTFTTDVYNWFPTWSPDGTRLVFASNRSGSYQLYGMNVDGSAVQALAEGCIAAFAPDGQRLVAASRCDGQGDILLMPASGGAALNLTDSEAADTNPSFSRDGQLIVYQSGPDGARDLFVMDLEGQLVRQLTHDPADDSAGVWQP